MGTAERNDPRFGLAGGAELWKDLTTGESYIVYIVPGTEDDPIRMRWTIPSDEDLQSFFGPGQPINYQYTYPSSSQYWDTMIDFGSSTDIKNVAANPFDSWASTLEVEAASAPWILDDDYQKLLAMAVIEGRPLTAAEIESTNWWQTNTEAKRKWMSLYSSDPVTAQQTLDDRRINVENRLRDAGITDPDPGLVSFMANRVEMGDWSPAELGVEIQRMSDPYFADQPLRQDLQNFISDNSITFGYTSDMENEVRTTVNRWLGTNFGSWSDQQVGDWAGRLRNEPDAMEALLNTLKDQKQALFPEYDREADYQSIAAPWRSMIRNTWGTTPNDSDQMLQSIIRMNDAGEAGKYLTQEGLNRGNDNVVNSVQGAIESTFGGI